MILYLTASAGILLLVFGFLVGFLLSYTRFGHKLIKITPDPIINLAKITILGKNYRKNSGEIDQVLEKIISIPPRYTYDGDFEQFINDFDKYKRIAINFPSDRHDFFLSSQVIGNLDIQAPISKEELDVSDITIPVIGGGIPGLRIVRKHGPSKGGVILCPGHPENEDPLDDLVNPGSYQKGIGLDLAKEGYSVFIMGLRGFNTSSLDSEEFEAIASLKGYSWYGFLVSDAIMLRHHIMEQFRYDSSDLGYMGISTGGAVSMFASALDKNVPWAIICGFFGSFSYNFVEESHSDSGKISNILRYFEMRDYLLGTRAKQIHVINGEEDTFSARHARKQFDIVQSCPEARQRAEYSFYSPSEIGHEYDPELILSIFKGL